MTDTAARFTVGFIGLGVMGKPMASNVLKAGYPLVVHSRSVPPVEALAAAGARAATSPAEVAAQSDVVITMLPDSPDVDAVLRGPDGVFSAVTPGAIVIDMSTISPALTRKMITGTTIDVDAGEPLVSQDWEGYVKRRKEAFAKRKQNR